LQKSVSERLPYSAWNLLLLQGQTHLYLPHIDHKEGVLFDYAPNLFYQLLTNSSIYLVEFLVDALF